MFFKKKDKRKIYKTTDGYFNSNPNVKKHRRVAVIDQRTDDGALAVVKIYSKKDKSGKAYIDKLVLRPKNHSSLTEDSIVGKQVLIGVRNKDGSFEPIFGRDMEDTADKITYRELHKIKKGAGGTSKQNKATHKKKMKQWKRHFK